MKTPEAYRIRYQHTGSAAATSRKAALRAVRVELRVRRLSLYSAPDGLYCWRSLAEQRADCDGSRADAVIESPAQQESHG